MPEPSVTARASPPKTPTVTPSNGASLLVTIPLTFTCCACATPHINIKESNHLKFFLSLLYCIIIHRIWLVVLSQGTKVVGKRPEGIWSKTGGKMSARQSIQDLPRGT